MQWRGRYCYDSKGESHHSSCSIYRDIIKACDYGNFNWCIVFAFCAAFSRHIDLHTVLRCRIFIKQINNVTLKIIKLNCNASTRQWVHRLYHNVYIILTASFDDNFHNYGSYWINNMIIKSKLKLLGKLGYFESISKLKWNNNTFALEVRVCLNLA